MFSKFLFLVWHHVCFLLLENTFFIGRFIYTKFHLEDYVHYMFVGGIVVNCEESTD